MNAPGPVRTPLPSALACPVDHVLVTVCTSQGMSNNSVTGQIISVGGETMA